jgi:hypothetical protein
MFTKPLQRIAWYAYCSLVMVACLLAPLGQARAEGEENIPDGFRLVNATLGIRLYQKDYKNGSPDYVQVIDLSDGAAVQVLHGSITNPGDGKGVYGGDNARFTRQSIRKFWQEFTAANPRAFCVSNGQFFKMAESPSTLPFPLKKDGQVLTDGYGIKEFPNQKLMLEIWPDHVDIQPLSSQALYSSSAPNIVAGLTEDASKASKKAVGRTFIGVDDRDQDLQAEVLLLFNTRNAKPGDAAGVLREFGADKVMMLDGGGSTQLICNQGTFINTDRAIPQALGVLGADAPSLAARFLTVKTWPIMVEGAGQEIKIRVENRGLDTWRAGEIELILGKDTWAKTETLPLTQDVLPGDVVDFSWTAPGIEKWGVYPIELTLANKGAQFAQIGQPQELIVLPVELAGEQPKLNQALIKWSQSPGVNIEEQAMAYIRIRLDGQAPESQERGSLIGPLNLGLGAALWVPLAMLPIILMMIFVIRRRQVEDLGGW